jgi:hypothetical protein
MNSRAKSPICMTISLITIIMTDAVHKYSIFKSYAILYSHIKNFLISAVKMIEKLSFIKIFGKQDLFLSLGIILLELTKGNIGNLRQSALERAEAF